MVDDDYLRVGKSFASVEKAEPDAFEVAKDRRNNVSLPIDDNEIYQFLVAYQEGNAGRLVLDPR